MIVGRFTLRHIESLAELRAHAAAWDDLFARSGATLPTSRAELIAQWCETFAPGRPFGAVVIEHYGQWVAALPWIEKRLLGTRMAVLPGCSWSTAGELLLDPDCDSRELAERMVAYLRQRRFGWLLLDAIPRAQANWRAWHAALATQRVDFVSRRRFRANVACIDGDWEKYFASRHKNHRHQLRNAIARAEHIGRTEIEHFRDLTPEQVEPLLRTAFEIESSGWKGTEQSAVLTHPHAWDFYLQQARQLAEWGHLRITLLRCGGHPIASEYGWTSGGVYCSLKVGYDEAFRKLSPGQLLRYKLIEHFFRTREVDYFDFFGAASNATTKWATDTYSVDRTTAALGGPGSRAVLAAYRHIWPLVRGRRRDSCDAPAIPATLLAPVAI